MCIFFVLDVCKGEAGLLWHLELAPRAGARAGLRGSVRITFRTENRSCFNNRKSSPKMREDTQPLFPGRNVWPLFYLG